MEEIVCPVCDGDDFARTQGAANDPLLAGGRSEWRICKHCGLVLQNPRPTAEELDRRYSEHEYHARTDSFVEETFVYSLQRPKPLMDYVERFIKPPGTMIDIGCGMGGAVLMHRLRGWDAHGVEPDPELAAIGRSLSLDVRAEFFDEAALAEIEADLAYTCHAFEHFSDPLSVARAARARLREGGILFVCVPTFRRARTWAREWLNAAHTFMFTDRTLGNLLSRAGFETIDYRYNATNGELWLVARAVERNGDAQLPYSEDWKSVQRELGVAVPLRSAAWFVQRKLAHNTHHVSEILMNPAELPRGVQRKLARRRGQQTGA